MPKDTIFANDDGCKNAVSEQSSPGYRPHRPTFTWTANPPHLLGDACCDPTHPQPGLERTFAGV